MPYTVCPECGLRAYSAAAHSTADSCSRCGTSLPRRPMADRNGRHLRYATEALQQLIRSARP